MRLAETEAHAKAIERQLVHAQDTISVSLLFEDIKEQAQEYVQSKLQNLRLVLTAGPVIGKQLIRKHISKITLTPKKDEKNVLDISIDFRFACEGKA